MDNRGEIMDEEDRRWILIASHAITDRWERDDLMLGISFIDSSTLRSEISDGWAYGIREALIARKMGLSEGRGDAD